MTIAVLEGYANSKACYTWGGGGWVWVGCGEGVVYFMSPGHPTDINLVGQGLLPL